MVRIPLVNFGQISPTYAERTQFWIHEFSDQYRKIDTKGTLLQLKHKQNKKNV